MGLFTNLMLAWKNREKLQLISKEVTDVRTAIKSTPPSGYFSSEFLVIVLTSAITLYNGLTSHQIDAKLAVEIAAGLAGAYTGFRTLLKAIQTLIAMIHNVGVSLKPAPAAAVQNVTVEAPVAPVSPIIPPTV